MSGDKDDSEKTEEPTARKLEEALKQGDVVQSPEVATFFILAAGALALAIFGTWAAQNFTRQFRIYLEQPDRFVIDSSNMVGLLQNIMLQIGMILAPVLGLLMLVGAGAHLIQHRPVFTAERLKPKFSKLSPLSGFKRLFGFEGWLNLAKGLLKIGIIGTVTWLVLWPERYRLESFMAQEPTNIAGSMIALLMQVLIAALAVLGLIAAGDYLVQRMRYMKRQRMSRQEIKDEHKQSEGDPAVKAKIKQLRMERSRRRMMAQVPDASVVIMNPTHFAVALKYESGKMSAPICVAKGVDALALRIRALAEDHNVPVIENPPLARALYATVELDEPVPPEHYKAVAQVIGYVMRLSGEIRSQ